MSGHSKWHSIKHKKGKEDAKRGQLFGKLSQKITVAARESLAGNRPAANRSSMRDEEERHVPLSLAIVSPPRRTDSC